MPFGSVSRKISYFLFDEQNREVIVFTLVHTLKSLFVLQITEFDACPRKPCNNGYYPIHEAAKNASSRTMEVFFQVYFDVQLLVIGVIKMNKAQL